MEGSGAGGSCWERACLSRAIDLPGVPVYTIRGTPPPATLAFCCGCELLYNALLWIWDGL